MALTVTTDLTVIASAENAETWTGIQTSGGSTVQAEPDFYAQGAESKSRAVTGAGFKGAMFDFGAGIDFTTGTHQDKLVYVWMRTNVPTLNDTIAAAGVAIRLSSSSATTNYREWYVDGNNTVASNQGWTCYVIDPQSAGSADSGTYVATGVRYYGGYATTTATAKGQNWGIDRISYGRGELRVTGTITTAGKGMAEIAAYDWGTIGNRFGIITIKSGIYYVRGKIVIGHATSNTTWSSTNETVIFETPHYHNGTNIVRSIPNASVGSVAGSDGQTSYLGLGFIGGSGTTTISMGTIVGTDAGRSGSTFIIEESQLLTTPAKTLATISVDNSTMGLSLYASNFVGFEGVIDLSGTGVSGDDCFSCSFNGCGRLASNMEIRNVNVINSVASATDGAVIWDANTDIEKGVLANNSRAIVFESSSGTPFTFVDLTFGGNTFDVRNEATDGDITINYSGGTTPTKEDVATSTTTLTSSVQVTFAKMKDNSEVRVFLNSSGAEIAGIEDATTGSTDNRSFAWSTTPSTVVDYVIHNFQDGVAIYKSIRVNSYTVPTANTTIDIQQQLDRNVD